MKDCRNPRKAEWIKIVKNETIVLSDVDGVEIKIRVSVVATEAQAVTGASLAEMTEAMGGAVKEISARTVENPA